MNKKVITATLVLSLLTSTTSFAAPFTDTTDQGIDYAYQNNLMKGMTANKFEPNTTLTRAQFATVLANLTKETPSGSLPFTDVKKGAYYYNPVLWAYNNKIISGVTDKTFSPNDTLNREQVASMISAYWKKYLSDTELDAMTFNDLDKASPWAKETIKFSGQVFKDAGIITTTDFEPKKAFTRLEVAKLISHLDKLKKLTPIKKEAPQVPTQTPQNQEPPLNNYIRMNNELVSAWWAMINSIKNESTTPTEEQKVLLETINKERQKLLLSPLQLMNELKPITQTRAKEAHAWYTLYALNKEKAPSNQKTPYIRPTTGTTFQDNLEANKELFNQTKFYQFVDQKEKVKIFKNTFEKSFTEYLIYGSDKETAQDIANTLLKSSDGYKLITSAKYTHVYFVKHAENGHTTWAVLFFNENAGKTLLKTFPLN